VFHSKVVAYLSCILVILPMKIHFAVWEIGEQCLRQIIDLLGSKEEWTLRRAAETNLRVATSQASEIYLF